MLIDSLCDRSSGKSSHRASSKGKSRASTSSRKRQIKRRSKRIITFSEWEADTYIPQIKASWDMLNSQTTSLGIGMHFYKKYLGDNPEMSTFFTSQQVSEYLHKPASKSAVAIFPDLTIVQVTILRQACVHRHCSTCLLKTLFVANRQSDNDAAQQN